MTTTSTATSMVAPPHSLTLRRVVAVVVGALLVAVAAQVAVPLPGTPVPITFQVPAVLLVGGLLGPRLGAASLVLYLAMGVGGLPVFAPAGPPGFARLLGPTGGYLLAMPLAAGLTGLLAARGRSWGTVALGVVVGAVVIHVGGVAQLGAWGLDMSDAMRLGSLPFWAGDVLKLTFAGLLIHKFGRRLKALR
ncbi:MAG: biotin transporter BioY [Gemmatimonadetes bacterium]|nr:biotin transporter BioY [Gemmatimonadota bacterium]